MYSSATALSVTAEAARDAKAVALGRSVLALIDGGAESAGFLACRLEAHRAHRAESDLPALAVRRCADEDPGLRTALLDKKIQATAVSKPTGCVALDVPRLKAPVQSLCMHCCAMRCRTLLARACTKLGILRAPVSANRRAA